MSTESETKQNVNAVTSEKPLTQEERDYYTQLMHEPDDTCQMLNQYARKLLGYPMHIVYIDNHYRVIGVNTILLEFRSWWWDLGVKPTQVKQRIYWEYLYRVYDDKRIPHQTIQLMRQACNSYDNWLTAIYGLVRTLKVKDRDISTFIDRFETDCREDGGINCDNLVFVYWINKMVDLQFDPDRSPESIVEEFTPKPKPIREPKIIAEVEPKAKPEKGPQVKPESPPQELINFD